MTCPKLYLGLGTEWDGHGKQVPWFDVDVERKTPPSHVKSGENTTTDKLHAEKQDDTHMIDTTDVTNTNLLRLNLTASHCLPQKSFVFIKVHKAGSHNTACILQRFVWSNNLTIVLPMNPVKSGLKTHDLNYVNLPFYPPYDVMLHHLPYNRAKMANVMQKNVVFIAILRYPLSHLKSIYNYRHLDRRFGLPLEGYLSNPKYLFGTILYKTRNWQAFMMGIPPEYSGNNKKAQARILELGKEFDHVMILEYYDESLILLKRKLCWKLQDILYDKQIRNYRSYSYKKTDIPEKLKENHKRSSDLDYMLYSYFNKTLWREILKEGEDFQNEVELFRRVNYKVNLFCNSPVNYSDYVIEATTWNAKFTVDQTLCSELKMLRIDWDKRFFARQGKVPEGMGAHGMLDQ
ncbi:PREDICTED: galactosylceramide sulfotransferase-like [Branchiostoma belcheri]|uniref:Galactosylceramide sulfotransferase-like n=1 Tax=Branchiostoma belcheri TaxID=7741 RepID=A0A6P4YH32_BRABE|nr:PREDICTED: galactosylceramide sulfotransferase-like [Branchiostoma belcheri]